MPIHVQCPNPQCAMTLEAPDENAGQKGRCPGCGQLFMIPASTPLRQASPADPLVGLRLGVLELKQKLGQGGMGAVYLAVNTTLDRLVAVKILPEDLVARTPAFLCAKRASRPNSTTRTR